MNVAYLVIDLEMSGTDADWHDIIQIGAVLYDENWQEKGQFLDDVYPQNYHAFNKGAEEIHGVSIYDLQDAPLLGDLLPELEDWIMEKLGYTYHTPAKKEGVLRNVILCGQSVINDIHFLKVGYKREKLKFPFSYTLLDLHTLSYFVFQVLRKLKQPTPKGRSLTSIAHFFGFERENETHNALEDAILTAKCFKKMWEIAQNLALPIDVLANDAFQEEIITENQTEDNETENNKTETNEAQNHTNKNEEQPQKITENEKQV